MKLRSFLGLSVASALVPAALAGCGGNGGGSLTLAEYGDRTPAAICGVLRECYGSELLDAFAPDCENTFGISFDEAQLPVLQAAIEAGTLEYHGDRAQACLDAITASDCSALDNRAPAACEETLVGTVAMGGACSLNEECAGDAYCDENAACGGTCQARVGSGSACEGDDACQSGLKCYGGTCRTPAGEGAACEGSDMVGCAGGLVCLGAMGMMPGECTRLADAQTAALGAVCNPDGGPFCQSGLACALTGVSGTMPVWECVAASASGGSCNLGFPDPCPTGEYCNAMPGTPGGSFEGTCVALPTDGEPCVNGQCAAGHRCDTTAGGSVCNDIEHIGGPCTSGSDCYSLVCDGTMCVEGMLCE